VRGRCCLVDCMLVVVNCIIILIVKLTSKIGVVQENVQTLKANDADDANAVIVMLVNVNGSADNMCMFTYNPPKVNTTATPTLRRVLNCRPRSNGIGVTTVAMSVKIPSAACAK
jgi:hypothetical protein